MSNYSETIMYKIVCKDESVTDSYVGHTTNFHRRKTTHKESCTNEKSRVYDLKVYQTIRDNGGLDNWNMIEIEKYPCENIDEAKDRERYWIETLGATLNSCIPNRTKKEYYMDNQEHIKEKSSIWYEEHKNEKIEYQKEYVEEHKDKITTYKKEYYLANKEILAEKGKAYREANKEKVAKTQHEKYERTKEKKLEYQKEYSQENKEHIAEYKKQYALENKERIALQRKAYREANKERIALQKKEYAERKKLEKQQQEGK